MLAIGGDSARLFSRNWRNISREAVYQAMPLISLAVEVGVECCCRCCRRRGRTGICSELGSRGPHGHCVFKVPPRAM
jgi:hypothetical protein